MDGVIIIGAGLAGLSAALTLSKAGTKSVLVSAQPSERAQSVLAEGGINAALDAMGEGDSPDQHFADTMRAGGYIADAAAVRNLTERAPGIVAELEAMGVPFNHVGGHIAQRNFGGQKKKRTVYARSSTGKIVMSALIDAVRRYEADGLVCRLTHHELAELLIRDGTCSGAVIKDTVSGTATILHGAVILAFGGMNGMFPGFTTGTTANSGEAACLVFSQGVKFSSLEMIQYHPTTYGIEGKRCLISEAARGEGGRLFIERNGSPWYFMEEKYPELGNLMPRDVVSREMFFAAHDPSCGGQVYLDLTCLSEETWKVRLPDLRREIMHYLGIDAAKKPIPVEPGIHYFMGGIDVDACHRTNIANLYAAGECCSQYHGANRLGGNSMLGAMCGGRIAAENAVSAEVPETTAPALADSEPCSPQFCLEAGSILLSAMGILRSETKLQGALEALRGLQCSTPAEKRRTHLAEAMLLSALERKECRGANWRTDCPGSDDRYLGLMTAVYSGEAVHVEFRKK